MPKFLSTEKPIQTAFKTSSAYFCEAVLQTVTDISINEGQKIVAMYHSNRERTIFLAENSG